MQIPTIESVDVATSNRFRNKAMLIDWKAKTTIYELLSQYYVHQRSVIFIVDSVFES